jgi:putative acetyltransferase
MEDVKYFGNPETFAIRYAPSLDYRGIDENDNKFANFACCHFVLGGQIIGDKNEACYLKSWLYRLEYIKNNFKNCFDYFSHEEFESRSDEEIFALVWKANGDNNPDYDYLPVLDSYIWKFCHISIDETTDAYLITATADKDNIKFIWQGWREPCPEEYISKLFSTTVNRQFIIESLENCLSYIKSAYIYYFEIKKASIEDWQEIGVLFKNTILNINKSDYSEEQVNSWASAYNDEAFWKKKIDDDYFIMAVFQKTIIGFGSLSLKSYYLDMLYVHKDFQGWRVATKLVEDIEAKARELSISYLYTEASITAKPFFEKQGYKVVTSQEKLHKDIYFTNYIMEKHL